MNLQDETKNLENIDYEYFNRIKNKWGFKSTWNIFSVFELNSNHGFKNTYNLHYTCGDDMVIVPIEGNQWLDLWMSAEKAIETTNCKENVLILETINEFIL